jgi:hypothetical protein
MSQSKRKSAPASLEKGSPSQRRRMKEGEFDEENNIRIIERKIEALCTVNKEIIKRICQKTDSENLTIFEYMIRYQNVQSDRDPPRYKVEEVTTVIPCKQIVDCWRVPSTAHLPQVPDKDGLMYGNNQDLMDMTCVRFSDLVRINQQVIVAKRYTSMLRESIGLKFGEKFKRNFELVQVLLGMIETLLMGTESILREKEEEINRVNEQMARIFAQNDTVLSTPKYSLTGFTKNLSPSLKLGTLLSAGIHRWKVKVTFRGGYYGISFEVGVVTESHRGPFGNLNGNLCSAWGINQSGNIIPANVRTSFNSHHFRDGDILSFVLNCHVRTLTISINGDKDTTVIPNIHLPVHIGSIGRESELEIIQ